MKYPIFIPSRGRENTCLTANLLLIENIDFLIVVEPQDLEKYSATFGNSKLLVMQENNQGIAYVRNFIKDYAKEKGYLYHWQIDDNIKNFRIRTNGKNEKTTAQYCLTQAEVFVDLYKNIGGVGLTHTAFAFSHKNPIEVNKQIYSCVLIKSDLPISYRKETVDDTDFSLQILTLDNNYWCTLLLCRLLIEKAATLSMKGGNTEIEYKKEQGLSGRELRTRGLIKQWPGIFKYTYQYGRIKVLPSTIWRKFPQRPYGKT